MFKNLPLRIIKKKERKKEFTFKNPAVFLTVVLSNSLMVTF